MKNHLAFGLLFLIASVLPPVNSFGAVYYGNGATTGGGAVGNGRLSLSDNGSTVSGTFYRGNGSFSLNLVLYIDSVSGGFADTTQFADNSDALRTAVSGYYIGGTGPLRSTAYFASGFQADYAIALGVNGPNKGNLYHLMPGAEGSLEFIKSVNLTPNNTLNASSYSFNFSLADIGLPAGSGNYFRFQSTYVGIGGGAYRELESFESLGGTRGYSSVWFTNYNTYGVDPVPEASTSALAIFGGLLIAGRLTMRAWRTHSRRRG
ncbi:MAG TPA: hypothetical protein VL361_00495 [Candidatus Limnocylindrales bacterium]|jgi:hypothetical protein|nr:hypothetical protein [Candidatus Limnocylindrales bacterium]